MLTIGICDDCKQDRDFIEDEVMKVLFDVDEIRIERYSSGQELVEAIQNDEFHCNLLFLDIFMEPVDGMETARLIRNNQLDVDIIFVTKSTKHVYRGYTYKAFSYILKDTMHEDLKFEIQRYIQELMNTEECLNITSDGVQRRVPISLIEYVESNARKLTLHLNSEDISFYAKMGDIEPVLAERGFIRVHQSFMLRISRINCLSKDSVMLGDKKIPVSRKYYGHLREIFQNQ